MGEYSVSDTPENLTLTVEIEREKWESRNRDLDRHFSIEKEEVGHCRDCKHWDHEGSVMGKDPRAFCAGIGEMILTEPNFGCVKFEAK